MATYTDPETGEIRRSRRHTWTFAILFIVAIALMVWLMTPRNSMSIVVNPAQPPLSGQAAPPAPPGSVSGASTRTQTTPDVPVNPSPASPSTLPTPTQPPLHPSP